MIFDTVANLTRYEHVNKHLSLVLAALKEEKMKTDQVGKYEIEGNAVYYTVQAPELKTLEKAKWEAHRRYIDIHMPITDGETIACLPEGLISDWGTYDEQGDIEFSTSKEAGIRMPMQVGTFLLVFPGEAHMPGLGQGTCKKIVIKVEV